MSTDRRCLGLLVLLAVMVVPGCGYPEVSPKTYDLATALYGICNREDADKLDLAEKLVAESLAAGEITPKEAGWLNSIIETARAGDWDEAESEARRLMKDQVRRGENFSKPHSHESTATHGPHPTNRWRS